MNEIELLLQKAGRSFEAAEETLARGHGLHFSKSGLLAPRFHALLNNAFNLRQSADYEADAVVEEKDVIEVIRQGREFLAAATELLEKGS